MKLKVVATRKEPGTCSSSNSSIRANPYCQPSNRALTLMSTCPTGGFANIHCAVTQPSSAATIAVKREADGRGGSAWLHDAVCVGTVLPVSAPRNHFPLKEGHGPVLLLAGGIGITPLLAMSSVLNPAGQTVRVALLHPQSRGRAPLGSDREGYRR
ncbi:hypothetical protein LZK76_36225 (plasmid) [Rhizobium leguminosarum]|nr:hypothetical protein LZK76_36225 [Rhizobium leguminosarum]